MHVLYVVIILCACTHGCAESQNRRGALTTAVSSNQCRQDELTCWRGTRRVGFRPSHFAKIPLVMWEKNM